MYSPSFRTPTTDVKSTPTPRQLAAVPPSDPPSSLTVVAIDQCRDPHQRPRRCRRYFHRIRRTSVPCSIDAKIPANVLAGLQPRLHRIRQALCFNALTDRLPSCVPSLFDRGQNSSMSSSSRHSTSARSSELYTDQAT
ncbi:hypothetical protein PGT21_035791 [Puccinia graminis f. sp. tritici]|uniref:Uncharacterized protein n=1 Tax=Puccinia graminis f. sp. tritici TaxID=56615 RepID=A0A5B0QD23_PUCGR|nr:hypothetical protein PGT21_035791 [Puccinia graminis f. sp. tritici]